MVPHAPSGGGHSAIAGILGSMKHTFVVADPTLPDCPLVFASDSFLRLTGYTAEEILGQNCRFLQGEDTDRETVKQLRHAVEGGEPITARLLNYKKSGEPFWNLLTMTPVKNSVGKVTKIIGVQIDITQSSSASGALTFDSSVAEDSGQAAISDVTSGLHKMDQSDTAAATAAKLGAASILGSMKHTFVVADPTLPDCPLVFASDSFLRLTGYTAEEILGQNCRFLQGEDTDRETVKQLRHAVEGGEPITARLLNYKKSGEPFWNLLTMTPVKNSVGKVTKIIGVQIDITQSSSASGALTFDSSVAEDSGQAAISDVTSGLHKMDQSDTAAATAAKLGAASILGSMKHTFVVADPTLPDCPLVFASDSFLRLTGYTAEEILGQNCRFLQGEDTDRETVKQLRQAVEGGEPITARLLNYKKSGEPFWNLLTMTPVKNSVGKVTKIIGVQIDITQSSSASGALTFDSSVAEDSGQAAISDVTSGLHKMDQSDTAAATAAKLGAASILGSMKHTFVVADPTLPDCPLVFASDSFLRLTGYTAEEILGQNCRFLQGEDTDRETVKQLRQAVEGGEPITARLLNYKKSGEPFWNLLTMTPVKNSVGKVTKIIGVQIDITQSSSASGALTFDSSVAEDSGQAAISDVTSGLHKMDQSDTAASTAAKLGAASILGSMKHTFVVADPTLPDCPLVFASDSFLRLTGYTAEEILGQNCRFLQGEDTDRETVKQLRQAVEGGEPITARLLNYKKCGEPFWNLLTMTPVKNSVGKVTKIIGVQVDITQSSKDSSQLTYNTSVKEDVSSPALTEIEQGISSMHAAKKKAAAFGSVALSSMQHTFVVSDPTLPDCPLVFASDSFCRLTGYDREEILGQNCRFLQGEATDRETVKRLGAAVREGMPITARLLNYKKSGEPFWNLLTMTPVRNSAGKVTKIIGVQIDVTQSDASAPEGMLSYNLTGKQNEGPMASQQIAKCLKTAGACSFSMSTSPLAPLIKAGGDMVTLVEEQEKLPLMQRLSQQLTRSVSQPQGPPTGAERAKMKRASRVPRVAIDLASTVERLEHAFVVCDPGMAECPIVFVHDAFAKMTGHSKEKILGQHPSCFMGTKGDKDAFDTLNAALNKGEEATIQMQSYRSSGDAFLSQLYTCPMKDADGACRFLVVVLVDLSRPEADAEEEPDYVPDVKEMTEAMKEVMSSEVEEGHNPFEAIDAVSGKIRIKYHACEDRGYKLLNNVTKGRPLQLSDLWMVKELGNGACGSVSMVELAGTGHCYALKSIDKEDMISRNKVHRVVAEDFILAQIDHPLLALCYCTISTPTHVHYLLQHCDGGDLYRLLNKQGQMKESHARFYAAEILMSLKYLHLLGFVYRDLKPENVLLLHGHAILSDFDLACTRGATVPRLEQCGVEDAGEDHGSTGRRWACGMDAHASADFVQRLRSQTMFVANPQMRSNSFVGTEEYLAPEVILGRGHSPAVDWWSYGILLYELVIGTTPFRGNSQDESFDNIVEKPLWFPKGEAISPVLRDLITGLLTKNPAKRLGTANGAEEIQQHPFFEGVHWSLLRHQKPPFRTSGSRNTSIDDASRKMGSLAGKGADNMSFNY